MRVDWLIDIYIGRWKKLLSKAALTKSVIRFFSIVSCDRQMRQQEKNQNKT